MNKEIFVSELREMLKHNYQDCSRIERMIRVLELNISQEEIEGFIQEEIIKNNSQPNSPQKPDSVKADNSRQNEKLNPLKKDEPIRRDNEDTTRTSIKKEIEKDYSISAEDICQRCGHLREQHHNSKSHCHFVNQDNEHCPCLGFVFEDIGVKDG